jgi:hypothetical protein
MTLISAIDYWTTLVVRMCPSGSRLLWASAVPDVGGVAVTVVCGGDTWDAVAKTLLRRPSPPHQLAMPSLLISILTSKQGNYWGLIPFHTSSSTSYILHWPPLQTAPAACARWPRCARVAFAATAPTGTRSAAPRTKTTSNPFSRGQSSTGAKCPWQKWLKSLLDLRTREEEVQFWV